MDVVFDCIFHALEADHWSVVEVAIVKVGSRELLFENEVSEEHVAILKKSRDCQKSTPCRETVDHVGIKLTLHLMAMTLCL